jgi:hypothetical protein
MKKLGTTPKPRVLLPDEPRFYQQAVAPVPRRAGLDRDLRRQVTFSSGAIGNERWTVPETDLADVLRIVDRVLSMEASGIARVIESLVCSRLR